MIPAGLPGMRRSLADAAGGPGVTVAVIGDAMAPRGTYEAVFEGHRHAREL